MPKTRPAWCFRRDHSCCGCDYYNSQFYETEVHADLQDKTAVTYSTLRKNVHLDSRLNSVFYCKYSQHKTEWLARVLDFMWVQALLFVCFRKNLPRLKSWNAWKR